MYLSLLTAGLSLVTAFGAPLQDTTPAPEPSDPNEVVDTGEPLYVGDVLITEEQIQRYLIFGVCRPALEYHRVSALIDDEIKRRVAAYEDELATWEAIKASGADPGPEPFKYTEEYFEISDEEFAKHRDRKFAEFMQKYPTLDLDTEMRRAYRAKDWYERELMQEMRFDKVFIPDNTEHWPDVTFEAMRQEAGDVLIKDFQESYERRKTYYDNAMAEWQAKKDAGEDAGPEPEMGAEDSMYRSILRQIVRDTLYSVIDTKTALDGLSPDLLVTMDFDYDGTPELVVTNEEVWEDIRDTVNRWEVNKARRFLALMEATRQRLAQEGKLLSEEEAAAHMEEVKAGFGSNIFGLGSVALGAHMFPSVEAYGEYLPLLEAYRVSVLKLTEAPEEGGLAPTLRQHLNIANQVMGLAKVDAEVLQVSAFDFENVRWKVAGWAKARQKAEWLKSEIERNGVEYAEYRKQRMQAAAEGRELPADDAVMEPHDFWSRLIDEHSDFWDPPPPTVGRPGSDHGYKKLGRFGERTRNDMRALLGESPFEHLLNGAMLTDTIFFKTPIGNVVGPIRGPFGFYLAKVIKRTPTARPLNINDERHLELLRDDWVRVSFIQYAHEALELIGTTGLRSEGSPRHDGDDAAAEETVPAGESDQEQGE